MRPRAIAFAATCALMFLLATPGSASATYGEFRYKYVDSNGDVKSDKLENPKSAVCHNISAETPDVSEAKPAHSPYNHTDDKAYLYSEEDCGGTEYILRADTGQGGTDMKFASVIFE